MKTNVFQTKKVTRNNIWPTGMKVVFFRKKVYKNYKLGFSGRKQEKTKS